MNISTVAQLRKRSIDRQRKYVDGIIASMARENLALHCTRGANGDDWHLSNGRRLRPETARRIIDNKNVIDCGDALFADAPAQTFRVIE